MTIIQGIPTWQHEDFIFRNPTIDVKDKLYNDWMDNCRERYRSFKWI